MHSSYHLSWTILIETIGTVRQVPTLGHRPGPHSLFQKSAETESTLPHIHKAQSSVIQAPRHQVFMRKQQMSFLYM